VSRLDICCPCVAEVLHPYGPHLTRVRLEAAERLRRDELRTVAGAARYLGIGQSTLYHYEDGTKRPSLETLEEMANHYGVMAGDMLPSKAIRSGEVAGIIAPLMTIPIYARDMFIRQMAAFADALASTIEVASAQALVQEHVDETAGSSISYNLQPSTPKDISIAEPEEQIAPHEYVPPTAGAARRAVRGLRPGAERPDPHAAPKRTGTGK